MNMNDPNNGKKSVLGRILDYAFYPQGANLIKCFFASICFSWGVVAIFSFVLALPSLITGGSYIKVAAIIE
jgi:uncharacterized protein (DUF486 family)